MKQLIVISAFLLSLNTAWAANKDKEALPAGLIEHTTDAKSVDEISDEQLTKWAVKYLQQKEVILTPEQRRAFQKQEQEKTDALLNVDPPNARLEILPISMDPAAKPTRIYLSPGWDTHLSIIDANGSPWPIQYYSVGNSAFKTEELGGGGDSEKQNGQVSIKNEDEEGQESTSTSNMNTLSKLKLISTNRAGGTNLTLLLQGMKEVINVQLVANTKQYYPSPVLQLSRIGPYSNTNFVPAGISMMSHDKVMRDIAMGGHNLPESYIQIETDNPKVKAWKNGRDYFIRSPYYSKVPRPLEGQSGTGGYKAYRIRYLPAITMQGDGNKQIIVKLYKNRVVEKNVKKLSY